MSGGSFDYLYSRLGTYCEYEQIGNALAAYLAEAGESRWISSQALADINGVAALLRIAEQLANRLSPVLKEVEWHLSCDTSLEDVVRAAREYDEKLKAAKVVP